MYDSSGCLSFSSIFGVSVFNFSHSGVSLWFYFALPWWLMMSTFSHAYWLFIYLWEVSNSFVHIFFQLSCFVYVIWVVSFLLLSCRSSFYILDISPLWDIFCEFILPEYILYVDWYSFSLWLMVFCVLRNTGLLLCHEYSLIFSSRNFIILGLTFRSIMHFELLFVYGVRLELDLFFSTRLSIISAPLIEKTFLFPKALFWCLYQKSNDCINVGLFMGSLLFYWSICLCLCQYHIITITVSQKWGSVSPPVFVKTALDVLGPLYFHFRTCLPLAGIMIGIYISVWEEFLSLQYLVFQCINMTYLPILVFFTAMLCSFQGRGLTSILLNLFQSISCQ